MISGVTAKRLIERLKQEDPDTVVYVKDDVSIGFGGYPEGYDYYVLGDDPGVEPER